MVVNDGQNLKHRRVSLNIRNHFVTVRVTEHPLCKLTLPSEFVESPFSEFLRTQHELCAVAGLRVGVVDLQQHL